MIHVLIVDDEAPIRLAIRMALEDVGNYAVEEERAGGRAIATLRASHVPYVVLLDVYPHARHRGLILDALAADPALGAAHAFILMTAGRREDAEAALSPVTVPGWRLVAKPFDLDELQGLVAEAAQRLPLGRAGA